MSSVYFIPFRVEHTYAHTCNEHLHQIERKRITSTQLQTKVIVVMCHLRVVDVFSISFNGAKFGLKAYWAKIKQYEYIESFLVWIFGHCLYMTRIPYHHMRLCIWSVNQTQIQIQIQLVFNIITRTRTMGQQIFIVSHFCFRWMG